MKFYLEFRTHLSIFWKKKERKYTACTFILIVLYYADQIVRIDIFTTVFQNMNMIYHSFYLGLQFLVIVFSFLCRHLAYLSLGLNLGISFLIVVVKPWQLAFLFWNACAWLKFWLKRHPSQSRISQINSLPAAWVDKELGYSLSLPKLLCFRDLGWLWDNWLFGPLGFLFFHFKFPFLCFEFTKKSEPLKP